MLCIEVNWKGTRLEIVETGDFAMVHVGKVDDLDSNGDKIQRNGQTEICFREN